MADCGVMGELDVIQGIDVGSTSEKRIAICLVLCKHLVSLLGWTDIQGEECGGTSGVAGKVEGNEKEGEVQVVDEMGFQMEISRCAWRGAGNCEEGLSARMPVKEENL